MQIVIDIDEKDYQVTLTKIMLACRGCKITELAKHGRLIDADALWDDVIQKFDCCDDFLEILENAPTVIEKE